MSENLHGDQTYLLGHLCVNGGKGLRWILRNCVAIVDHCNDPSTSAK